MLSTFSSSVIAMSRNKMLSTPFFDTLENSVVFVCSRPVVALLLGSTTHGWTGRVALIMANWKPSSTTKRKKTPYYESSFTQLSDCIPVVNAARGTFSLMEFNAHCQLLFKLVFSSTTQTHGTLLRLNWAGFAARHHEENFWKEIFRFQFMLRIVAQVVMLTPEGTLPTIKSRVTFLLRSTASRLPFLNKLYSSFVFFHSTQTERQRESERVREWEREGDGEKQMKDKESNGKRSNRHCPRRSWVRINRNPSHSCSRLLAYLCAMPPFDWSMLQGRVSSRSLLA